MLKNQDIVCISSIDWDFIWQGHQEIMSVLAKNGNRVLFIENTGVRSPGIRDIPRIKKRIHDYFLGVKGIRKELDNLYIFSPLVLPFPYSRIARRINKILLSSILQRWMKVMDFADPIVWTFLPTGITLDIIDNLNHKLVVYYCIDSFSVSSSPAKKIRPTEKKLLKKADLVFVTSKALYDYCAQYSNKVSIFAFGVSIGNFEKARLTDSAVPNELKCINKPIVGYVGGIHKWIDQGLVKSLAETSPEYSFVFVGPIQTDISLLQGIKNIYFLGNRDHQELPYLIKNFSVTIIPYLVNAYTKNVYPTKLNEYLAMGKPIVSTDLPEIRIFNKRYTDLVYVGRNSDEYRECIELATKEDSQILKERRIKIAHENSWYSRIEQMSRVIKVSVNKKLQDRESSWKENLLVFFRAVNRRFIRIILVLSLVYTLVFFSPLLWFLAAPLKIVEQPQKADAIVVFAGGVGESGKAGQGYEERVRRAVELYEKGYANYVIFSSGYTFVFREPEVMKALAVSLGVPKKNIFLETKASNTYENIRNTTEILNQWDWRSILLVSSPYHMRRASMVFNKYAPQIDVIKSPIEKSQFYARHRRVLPVQIRGIFHEYLAILYYYLKGWL